MTEFQSTHSLRSATGHVPRNNKTIESFNPRTPCGVRHYYEGADRFAYIVSIHALLAECDYQVFFRKITYKVSIHALLAECDSSKLLEASEF